MEENINKIIYNENELFKLTQRLGYTNNINKPSDINVYLPKSFLRMTEENYKKSLTNIDDLTVLFSYCNLSPKDFGYEEDYMSDEAKALEAKLKVKLGE